MPYLRTIPLTGATSEQYYRAQAQHAEEQSEEHHAFGHHGPVREASRSATPTPYSHDSFILEPIPNFVGSSSFLSASDHGYDDKEEQDDKRHEGYLSDTILYQALMSVSFPEQEKEQHAASLTDHSSCIKRQNHSIYQQQGILTREEGDSSSSCTTSSTSKTIIGIEWEKSCSKRLKQHHERPLLVEQQENHDNPTTQQPTPDVAILGASSSLTRMPPPNRYEIIHPWMERSTQLSGNVLKLAHLTHQKQG